MSLPNENLVCWSGGCDSTLLLHHTARLYGTPQSPVRALSITCDQVTSAKKEAQARKRLLKKLKKLGLHIDYSELSITTVQGTGLDWHGLPQAVLWLLSTQVLRKRETLSLGYVAGDCWIQYVEAFQTVFDTLQRVSDRTGTLWRPLMYTEKRGVLHQLRELELLDLTWWCEVLDRKKVVHPCGKCKSCMTHETALFKLDKFGPGHYWKGNPDGS